MFIDILSVKVYWNKQSTKLKIKKVERLTKRSQTNDQKNKDMSLINGIKGVEIIGDQFQVNFT